jgi:hypothetical protein
MECLSCSVEKKRRRDDGVIDTCFTKSKLIEMFLYVIKCTIDRWHDYFRKNCQSKIFCFIFTFALKEINCIFNIFFRTHKNRRIDDLFIENSENITIQKTSIVIYTTSSRTN